MRCHVEERLVAQENTAEIRVVVRIGDDHEASERLVMLERMLKVRNVLGLDLGRQQIQASKRRVRRECVGECSCSAAVDRIERKIE